MSLGIHYSLAIYINEHVNLLDMLSFLQFYRDD